MATIAVLLVAAAVGVGVWVLGHHGGTPRGGGTPSNPPPSTAPAVQVLQPAGAAAFGPSSSPSGTGGDNPAQAQYAIAGKPGQFWYTDSYQGSPLFGNLYNGTGLIVNMGKPVSVSSVTVAFGHVPGSHVRIEVGNNNTGKTPTGFTTVSRSNDAVNTITFTARRPVSGQYVLIWFTLLAPQQGKAGHYQADVFNVVVKGSP